MINFVVEKDKKLQKNLFTQANAAKSYFNRNINTKKVQPLSK